MCGGIHLAREHHGTPRPFLANVAYVGATDGSNSMAALVRFILGLTVLSLLPLASAGFADLGNSVQGRTDPIAACAGSYGDNCGDPGILPLCGEDRVALQNVCDAFGMVGRWCRAAADCSIGDPTLDRDHDLLSDEVEKTVCGRSSARVASAMAATAYTRCKSPSDMSGFPDDDRDGLPDTVEPALCAIEDQNTAIDGSCSPDGVDYRL